MRCASWLTVFLLLLTVPALEWLLAQDKHKSGLVPSPSDEKSEASCAFVRGEFKGELNEEVYKRYFKKAFEDKEDRYGSLTIYEVPACIYDGTGTANSQ